MQARPIYLSVLDGLTSKRLSDLSGEIVEIPCHMSKADVLHAYATNRGVYEPHCKGIQHNPRPEWSSRINTNEDNYQDDGYQY